MKDWREIHMARIRKEQRAILLEGATTEQWQSGGNAKRWPVGSIYLWSLGVCGPIGSAKGGVDEQAS